MDTTPTDQAVPTPPPAPMQQWQLNGPVMMPIPLDVLFDVEEVDLASDLKAMVVTVTQPNSITQFMVTPDQLASIGRLFVERGSGLVLPPTPGLILPG